MYKLIVAVGLLAVYAMAQDRPRDSPPRPPAPSPAPAPGPAPPRPEGEEDKEEEEPCPPRTGREWVCRIDWFDHEAGNVLRYNHRQKCDERDLCYIGPIVSRSLNEAWERKWMCGPKPCAWRGEIDGETKEGEEECSGVCDMGPHDIWINGTWKVSAFFCRETPEDQENKEDMEDMMAPMWAPPVCSVNSSLYKEQVIKECEGSESCRQGPYYAYNNGTQFAIYMCTETPSTKMPPKGSKTEEIMWKIHNKMKYVANELVKNGQVFHQGAHRTMYDIGKKLKVLKSHLSFMEQQAKEKGSDKMDKMPDYVEALRGEIHMSMVMLHNQVVEATGKKGDEIVKGLRTAWDELYKAFVGEADLKKVTEYVVMNMQSLVQMLRSGNFMHDMAKAVYRNTHELMIHAYEIHRHEEGDNSETLGIMERMGDHMQYVWNFMTNGHVVPGNTPISIAQRLADDLMEVREKLMNRMSPKDRIYDILGDLEKISNMAKERKLMSMEARRIYDTMALEKLAALRHFTNALPNAAAVSPMLDGIVRNFNELWNHMTGGMTSSFSTPEIQIATIMNGLGDLLKHIEEGVKQRDQDTRQPGPGQRGPGQGPPQQGDDGDRRLLDEVQERLSDIGRRMMDEGRSPGEQALHYVVDSIRQLHEDLSGIRRIAGGPEQVVSRLSENLGRLLEDFRQKGIDLGGDLGNAFDMVRRGASELVNHLRDRARGDPADFFRSMVDGMERIASRVREMDSGDNSFVERIIQTLRNLRSGGPSPPGPGQGNDDLRRQLGELQSTVRELMMRMMDNRGRGRGRDEKGDTGYMRGRDEKAYEYGRGGEKAYGYGRDDEKAYGYGRDDEKAYGYGRDDEKAYGYGRGGEKAYEYGRGGEKAYEYGRGGQKAYDNGRGVQKGPGAGMMGDMGDMEEPCPEPFWMRQIPRDERMRWGHGDDSFFGPMPPPMEQPDNDRK